MTIKLIIATARPERRLPVPPHPPPKLDESPGQSAGCDWSGGLRWSLSSSPLHTSQDRCHPQTKTPMAPATQFQKTRNLRWQLLVACPSRGLPGSSFEMLRQHVLSHLGHSSQVDNG